MSDITLPHGDNSKPPDPTGIPGYTPEVVHEDNPPPELQNEEQSPDDHDLEEDGEETEITHTPGEDDKDYNTRELWTIYRSLERKNQKLQRALAKARKAQAREEQPESREEELPQSPPKLSRREKRHRHLQFRP